VLTVQQAANVLGVSPGTLRNWDKSGRLPVQRDPGNGYRRYVLEDVLALMRERSAQTRDVGAERLEAIPPDATELVGRESSDSGYGVLLDERGLRLRVRQMSKAFRDSLGGSLMGRFEEITKLLYCKLYEERVNGIGQGGGFRRLNGESVGDCYRRIGELYAEAVAQLPDLVQNGLSVLSDDEVAVVRVVELLEDVQLGRTPADVKGSVYEELVRNTLDKSENQQFFTPRSVVAFMVDLLDPRAGETVVDPACGSGGFLIRASETVSPGSGGKTPHLVGIEVDRRMAWVAQMNLVMHGQGIGTVHYLGGSGSLGCGPEREACLPDGMADAVITNPPFGSDFSDELSLQDYVLGRGRSSRRRGVLFIERCIRLLRPGGRLAIIIDDSVLNGNSTEDARRLILAECDLQAVVSLPEVTFMPYASVKSSILFLRKKMAPSDPQGPVFMAEAQNVGRRPNGDPYYGAQRSPNGHAVLVDDLPAILGAWRQYRAHGEGALEAGEPIAFAARASAFSDSDDGRPVPRLDVPHHHPSRQVAVEMLSKSGYPVASLGELVATRGASVIPAVQDPDEIWRYVGLANISQETGLLNPTDIAGHQLKSSVKFFRPGDILFAKMRPELRKCAVVPEDEDEGYATSECLVMRTVEDSMDDSELRQSVRRSGGVARWKVDREYLGIMLRSDIVFGQLVYQVTGTGRPRVSTSAVMSLRIPIPPVEVQREIVAVHMMAIQQHAEFRLRAEQALRDGESAIRSAHRFAQEALSAGGGQKG